MCAILRVARYTAVWNDTIRTWYVQTSQKKNAQDEAQPPLPCYTGWQVIPGVVKAADRFMARWHRAEVEKSDRSCGNGPSPIYMRAIRNTILQSVWLLVVATPGVGSMASCCCCVVIDSCWLAIVWWCACALFSFSSCCPASLFLSDRLSFKFRSFLLIFSLSSSSCKYSRVLGCTFFLFFARVLILTAIDIAWTKSPCLAVIAMCISVS